jgi:AhpD family alkylhydroperoxidase
MQRDTARDAGVRAESGQFYGCGSQRSVATGATARGMIRIARPHLPGPDIANLLRGRLMALVPLLTDEQADPQARAVFDDIRATRGTEYINNIWRALANDPAQLASVWSEVKRVMAPGALDPLTKELVYIAVSAANNCGYCLHTHVAAARGKGMTEAMFNELMRVIVLASQTNRIAIGLQVETDARYASPPP